MLIISHNTMRYRCLMLCSTLLSVRQSAYIGEYNGFMYASDTCEGFMCMYKDFMFVNICMCVWLTHLLMDVAAAERSSPLA